MNNYSEETVNFVSNALNNAQNNMNTVVFPFIEKRFAIMENRIEKLLQKQIVPIHLNMEEASKMLGISIPTLRNWIKHKEDLPVNMKGRKYFFVQNDSLHWFHSDRGLRNGR